MKTIEIGGKEYTLVYTIEASLYGELTEKITSIMLDVGMAQNQSDIKKMITSMSDVPQTVLTMLYAGLLEKHGTEVGDGTITCKADAKKLIRQYFEEHSTEEGGDFFSIMEMLIVAMADDDFFNRIGLAKMLATDEEAPKQPKQPQDHKRKEKAGVK